MGLSRFFWDFPDLLGDCLGFSRFVLFLFLGLLRAPARNSPESVRDTIWTFPKKVGNPGFGNPRFSFSQKFRRDFSGDFLWRLSAMSVANLGIMHFAISKRSDFSAIATLGEAKDICYECSVKFYIMNRAKS